MSPRLVGVVLEVSDLGRSIVFYRDFVRLKMTAKQEWEGHKLAFLEDDNVELTLLEQRHQDHAGAEGHDTPQLGKGVMVHLAVESIETQMRRLVQAQARFVRDLEEAPWGGRTFVAADPDGYNIMFTGP